MSKFFDDTMRGLLEAVEIEKGNVPLIRKNDMQAPTYVVAASEEKLIDELIRIRKEENVSQSQLAALTGNKQQAISRIEKKENCPSLKLFYNMVNALGYELQIVKKSNVG